MARDLGELQLRTLLTETTVGVLACDADGVLTMASKALQEVLGPDLAHRCDVDLAKEYGLRLEDGITALDAEENPLARARRGETVRDAVHVADYPGRGRVYLRFNAAPLIDDDRVVGAITTVQDITTERLAREEQAQTQLRLLSTLNHEIRTPLAALLGHAELLAGAGADTGERQELVEAICRASWRLRDVVATVAEVVAFEREHPLTRHDVDLADLVRHVVAGVRDDARAAGVDVRASPCAASIASVDRSWLLRALRVLLDSAIGASPQGGTVEMRLGGNDHQVWVNVVDHRPRSARSDRARGRTESALAVVMARMVAGAHGGELRIEELEPDGHRAELVLPRSGT